MDIIPQCVYPIISAYLSGIECEALASHTRCYYIKTIHVDHQNSHYEVYKNYKLHSFDDRYAIKIGDFYGWYKYDSYHRDDGPAVMNTNRYLKPRYTPGIPDAKLQYYYQDGVLHRQDGPAVITLTGSIFYINGTFRTGLPAIVYSDLRSSYYYEGAIHNDAEYSEYRKRYDLKN